MPVHTYPTMLTLFIGCVILIEARSTYCYTLRSITTSRINGRKPITVITCVRGAIRVHLIDGESMYRVAQKKRAPSVVQAVFFVIKG